MKKFTHPDFQTQLSNIITDLEHASQIEVVVLIKQRSANYEDVPLGLGINLSVLTFSYLFLIDTDFDSYMVYFTTLTAFTLGALLGLIDLFQQKHR